ncbi:major capsid protein P2 [Pseudoalteromonas aurantia]|uniref:Viral coat protein P2 N-terminal domain-containing protein n=1 Tax=Pseudoalteromonas aurantia TaxID=43654 RepID=A0ABY2VYT5_9GAMM|nr:major capsid protein P2 [Pseudoalteromonas aurantia]TMO75326.1 hypothetical protein CWC20_08370 [Pseudoalteromonas aurantia]
MTTLRTSRLSKIPLDAKTGNSYDETWNIKLQAGLTYHRIDLKTNLNHVKTIRKITIDVNGNDFLSIKNTRLDLLKKLYQVEQETGRFVINFSDFKYRTATGIYQTQLVTQPTDDVTVKIEFGERTTGVSGVADDPVSPTLKSTAYVTDTDRFGRIFKPTMYELTQSVTAAGEHTWIFPNSATNKFIQRMVFDENEVKIKKIKVMRGEKTIETFERDDLDFDLKDFAKVSHQDGYCLLDFTMKGYGSSMALPTYRIKFVIETEGTGAIQTFVQGFDQLKQLPKLGE